MKWIPIFNHLNCEQWIEHLMQLGLIKITKNVCHLVPPFTITINKEIHERISELYVPYEERGGLFFASIIKDNGNIILNIESVVMIENNVEQEFPYLSKGDHYFPNRILYNQTLSKNFSNENYLQILFPIHFHTHPNTNGDRMQAPMKLTTLCRFKLTT